MSEQGALHGLVDELRKRQGWTTHKLAEVAGISEQKLRRMLETPSQLTASDATVKALSKALQVDAWLLERASASPRENVGELVRLADEVSRGSLSRLRGLAGAAVPETLEEAVRIAKTTVSPTRQLELAELITLFARMDPADRQFVLALANRMVAGPLPSHD